MSANAQLKAPWGDKQLDSLERVFEALEHLNMPKPSRQAVSVIASSAEKARFRDALCECLAVNGVAPKNETKRYLFGLVSCVSTVIPQLIELGYQNVELEALIEIGKKDGMEFRAAVLAALAPSDPNHAESSNTVEQALTQAMESLGFKLKKEVGIAAPSSARTADAPNRPAPRPTPIHKPVEQAAAAVSEHETVHFEEATDKNTTQDNDYLSTHIYGKGAALCFNACISQKNKHVIIVDAALSTGDLTYGWNKAISIQLGHKELPLLFAVFAGWRNGVRFSAHGSANDKSLEVVRQEGKFYVAVTAKGEQVRSVPICEMDAYYVYTIIFKQIIRQAPTELAHKPELLIQMMKSTQNIKPALTQPAAGQE